MKINEKQKQRETYNGDLGLREAEVRHANGNDEDDEE